MSDVRRLVPIWFVPETAGGFTFGVGFFAGIAFTMGSRRAPLAP